MSIESFVAAMPKVELNVNLDGLVRKKTWLLIAEQNEVHAGLKRFNDWVELLNDPLFEKLDDLRAIVNTWPKFDEDLARMVYDAGVALSKQNIRYAEIVINPVLHMLPGMSLDDMIAALNDGRDRAARGWNITMNWILSIPRSEPRRADETVRWATSAAGKQNNVVAFSLEGKEDAQPIGQFERAFQIAHKKGLATVVRVGETLGAAGIAQAIEVLEPSRLVDGWGLLDNADLVKTIAENNTPLIASIGRARTAGLLAATEAYPLRTIYDEDIQLILSSDLPEYYRHTITDEYLAAVTQESDALSLEELKEVALNAVRFSFLDADAKQDMVTAFTDEFNALQVEHIEEAR